MIQKMTSSRDSCRQRCNRLEYYRYQRGYRSVTSRSALDFGTLFHGYLDGWNRAHGGGHPDTALDVALSKRHYEATELQYLQAEVLMVAYDAIYGPSMAGMDVLDVELEFEVPLIGPDGISLDWLLAGVMDVLVIDRSGRIWIIEHKTRTGEFRPGSAYWASLRMDKQISIYFSAAKALGIDVYGVIYDVIGKPLIRPLEATPEESRKYTQGKKCPTRGKRCPKKTHSGPDCENCDNGWIRWPHVGVDCVNCGGSGWLEKPHLYSSQRDKDETMDEYRERLIDNVAENPDKYFARFEIVRNEIDVQLAHEDIWATTRGIESPYSPRNPNACHAFGSTCEFFSVCTGVDSLESSEHVRRSNNVHPELTT